VCDAAPAPVGAMGALGAAIPVLSQPCDGAEVARSTTTGPTTGMCISLRSPMSGVRAGWNRCCVGVWSTSGEPAECRVGVENVGGARVGGVRSVRGESRDACRRTEGGRLGRAPAELRSDMERWCRGEGARPREGSGDGMFEPEPSNTERTDAGAVLGGLKLVNVSGSASGGATSASPRKAVSWPRRDCSVGPAGVGRPAGAVGDAEDGGPLPGLRGPRTDDCREGPWLSSSTMASRRLSMPPLLLGSLRCTRADPAGTTVFAMVADDDSTRGACS
jgi:hypothetical protein